MAPKRRTKGGDGALSRRASAAAGRQPSQRGHARAHPEGAKAQKKSVGYQLKSRKGERIPALLRSKPISSTTRNGVMLYQTAIMDFSERRRAEEALRAKEAELEAIINRTPFMLTHCSRDLRYRFVSRAYAKMLGRTPEEIAGRPIVEIIGKEALKTISPHIKKVLQGQRLKFETEVPYRGIGARWMHSVYTPDRDSEGNVTGWFASIVDTTERKHAEQQLAEQARLLDLSNDAILVRDAQDRITYWNYGAKAMYGYLPEEALGKVTHELLDTQHPEPLKRIREKLERADRWIGELIHTRKDGAKIVVMSRWVLDRTAQSKPASILETNTDITVRKRAEAVLERSKELLEERVRKRTRELHAANKELKDEIQRRKGLEGELLEISDREQQRLGQELHDGLCQHLTAVAFMARSVALRLKNHRVIEVSDIEKIAQLVNAAATDTRNLSRALHRADIDSAGFITALQDLVDREIWKTPCRLEIKPSFHIDDDAVASHLYRIAREAVINANKHARAREILVTLARSRKETVLSVTDNGVGFHNAQNSVRGLGFHIMNYRARAIGGRLEIESPKKGGTRVACYLPDKALRSQKKENTQPGLFPAKIAKALAVLI